MRFNIPLSLLQMFIRICHPVYVTLKERLSTHIFTYYICITESQEGKSMVNGDSGFIINLSQDQKEQYGSQFEEDKPDEPPGILGELSN